MRSKILALIFMCFCLGSCNLNSSADAEEDDPGSDYDEYNAKQFPQEYQGTLKREDTGEEWIISYNFITTAGGGRVSTRKKNLEMQSSDIIKVTEGDSSYHLNKKRETSAGINNANPTPGGSSKPAKLSSGATASQASVKLDEIIVYSGTPSSVKAEAESYKQSWSAYSSNWGAYGPGMVQSINNLIDSIPDVSYLTLTSGSWYSNTLVAGTAHTYQFPATSTGAYYVHVKFGTLSDLWVRVIDDSGNTVLSQINLWGSTKSASFFISSTGTYYVEVWSYGSGSGTYQVAYNRSSTEPY